MVPGCNILAMTYQSLCSVVVPGLLVALCLCEPLHAGQDSQSEEPQQSRTAGHDLETLRRAAEQGDTDGQATLVRENLEFPVNPDTEVQEVLQGFGPFTEMDVDAQAYADLNPDAVRLLAAADYE